MSNLRFAAEKERRVALITGGARGIGGATAVRIAEEGRDIVIADVLAKEGAETVEKIEALGQEAMFVATDVTDESAVQACVAQTVERFGRLDILVCCAGILGWEKPFFEQPVAQFDKVMRINVYGVYHFHQTAIPHMLAGGWGRCVTITSGGAQWQPESSALFGIEGGCVFVYRRAGQCVLQRWGVCQWRGAGAGVDGYGGAEVFTRACCQSPGPGNGTVFRSGGGG